MPNFNQVILVGHLTRDPELRTTQGGTELCKCGIAVSEKFKKDGESREKVCFVDFHLWKKQAATFAEFCKKGDPIMLVGSLELEQWDDKDTGAKRSKHTVNVQNFQFLKGKDAAAKTARTEAPSDGEIPF
jgi:single-strand DNA-binding protein